MAKKVEKLIGSKKDRDELKAAREALAKNSERERKAGINDETREYLKANKRVADAEKKLPWLGR